MLFVKIRCELSEIRVTEIEINPPLIKNTGIFPERVANQVNKRVRMFTRFASLGGNISCRSIYTLHFHSYFDAIFSNFRG